MKLLGLILNVVPPRVQNIGRQASGIDFGNVSAQGSKTLKMKLLGLILNVVPPRGPKYRKSSFWDRFWLCFCPEAQNVENEASGIDFERGSAEGSKISKVKLLGSILAMFLPRGSKR